MDIILLTANGTTSTGNIIFDVALGICAIVIAIYALGVSTKVDIINSIPKLIKDAQAFTELSGPDKMQWVIDQIKYNLPKLFNAVFTRQVLEEIAQNIYDQMKGYRETCKETEKQKETVINEESTSEK